MDREITQLQNASESIVLDWSRVRELDSSVARTVASWHTRANAAGHHIFHVKPKDVTSAFTELLQSQVADLQWQPDLDRALESAENLLLSEASASAPHLSVVWSAAPGLLRNLSTDHRAQVEKLMVSRFYKTGEFIFRTGEASDRLVVLQHGSADVLIDLVAEGNIRPTSFRRGALVGEIGFLDGSKRSADVLAAQDVMTLELSSESFERITAEAPGLAILLLKNMALEMGSRLRRSNAVSAQAVTDTAIVS